MTSSKRDDTFAFRRRARCGAVYLEDAPTYLVLRVPRRRQAVLWPRLIRCASCAFAHVHAQTLCILTVCASRAGTRQRSAARLGYQTCG